MAGKTVFALLVSACLAWSSQTLASSDENLACYWDFQGCLLQGVPILSPGNDSRDNLLRLANESHGFPLPVQSLPADITRSRDYYFAYHRQWDETDDLPPASPASSHISVELKEQVSAFQLDLTEVLQLIKKNEWNYGRNASNTESSVSAFFSALQEDSSLIQEQRHQLAAARVDVLKEAKSDQVALALSQISPDSTAYPYKRYLLATAQFYEGNYDAAEQTFVDLLRSKNSWLKETAQYMLMRTALNKSTQHSDNQYGFFDLDKVDRSQAALAQKAAQDYLHLYPEGLYTDSAYGMQRRINWYMKAWPQLAKLYEESFQKATDAQELNDLIGEYDSLYGISFRDKPITNAFPAAPVISFVEMLRALRLNQKRIPTLTQQDLDRNKPFFKNSGKLPLWNNLQLNLWKQTNNTLAILQSMEPAKTLPAHDVLAFSNQVLYGDALMAEKRWPQADSFWRHLLTLSQEAEQQQFIQARLTATLVLARKTDAIFAKDSVIRNLRYRSRVLKTQASLARLRQQAIHGLNEQERTIALHTLLIRDLTENHFRVWLADVKLIGEITPSVKSESFDDVDLSVFNWDGSSAVKGYVCPTLHKVVFSLSQNEHDAYALNCLGEFFRTTNARIDLYKDQNGNAGLEEALNRKDPYGQFDRQRYYQQVIASPAAKPEEKSYALYRVIRCYAPSGNSDCGGQQVSLAQRKKWFTLLKTRYPDSEWAMRLEFYW